jgi:NIMA (never in mitosis gene a)-related kinase
MNNFEIIQKLGDGSFSVVYKVRRKIDNNIYALKKVKLQKLKDREKQNALNEVRILASIKSPFIICYKEAFIEESDKSLCIVMEYANNGDLYQRIAQFKKMNYLMDESDVWRIFIQMVKGLKVLHDLKILHRDLKSANIFLFSDGTAKIGDCNVSKVIDKEMGYTQTGTPYYASPEVWNDCPYDNKSDIWSLGIVTYEMLALHPPFRAESMKALYKKIIKGQYPKISSKYSNDIWEIIKLLLKVNPNERPSCNQILKNKMVMERIDFFKDREGFKNDSFDSMDEAKLIKTLRLTKDILFLSQQLPIPNYDNNNQKKVRNIKRINIKNTTSLPNISTNSNYGAANEEKKILNSESSKKMIHNNQIMRNKNTNDITTYNNESHNSILIKTDNNNNLTCINKSENKTSLLNKDLDKTHNYDLTNNSPTYRLDQEKHGITNRERDFLKYTKGISIGNLYSIYAKETKKNNRINYNYRSPDKNNHFLPNIYKNKSKKQINKFALNRRY